MYHEAIEKILNCTPLDFYSASDHSSSRIGGRRREATPVTPGFTVDNVSVLSKGSPITLSANGIAWEAVNEVEALEGFPVATCAYAKKAQELNVKNYSVQFLK